MSDLHPQSKDPSSVHFCHKMEFSPSLWETGALEIRVSEWDSICVSLQDVYVVVSVLTSNLFYMVKVFASKTHLVSYFSFTVNSMRWIKKLVSIQNTRLSSQVLLFSLEGQKIVFQLLLSHYNIIWGDSDIRYLCDGTK